MKQKNRYDKDGNFDEHGRYDRSGNYVYTWSERKLALVIGVTLLALLRMFRSTLDKLPYSGVIHAILGVAAAFVLPIALWIAFIGRAHPDPD